MVDVARARKLAVRIREVVASTLEMQVKDPRLGLVTITDARVTPDLREAKVFYTVYGDATARAESAAALESAKGVVRSQVGRQTGIKFTPTLEFVADAVPETARAVEDLLALARARDEELAAARVGAQPAGEADPYRRPREEVDADADADSDVRADADSDAGAHGEPHRGPADAHDAAVSAEAAGARPGTA